MSFHPPAATPVVLPFVTARTVDEDHPPPRHLPGLGWLPDPIRNNVIAMIGEVKALGLETCATLGMLTTDQAQELKSAGLDFYNHNLDTSSQYYEKIISTRTYQDRLDTLQAVRDAGINVCCGGIVGMGEEPQDRVELLHTLATLPQHPQSVPINQLVRVKGTPLAESAPLDPFDFVRMIAVARILMPLSHVRLSAGRAQMSDELQALCFMAGANSIFYGEKLLTTGNPDTDHDQRLFKRLKIIAEEPTHTAESPIHTAQLPIHTAQSIGPALGPAPQSFPNAAGVSVAS